MDFTETHLTTNGHSNGTEQDTPLTILHLGDPIEYNHNLYSHLASQFNIIRPDPSCLPRRAFIQHLQDKTWGNFSAIMRPYWNTGNEMARWDRELIELLPHSMKVMASAGAGYDWVDVDVLAEYGILYCNGAGACTESVADMALYHIISVFRQMTRSSLAARSNVISQYQDAHRRVAYESHNPRDHTLGIVGLGNIGFAIAKKVRNALGMRILYFDVQRKSREQEREVGATFFDDRDELFRQSDCLLLATPAGPPVLTRRALELLPRGARVVNIARGSLVDEDALADALESGHVSAAGLDVHRKEPQVSKRLSEMQNVTLTSHTGGSSLETVKGFERLAMENVDAVLNGEEPLTAVNKQAVEMHLQRDYANGVTVVNGHVNGQYETNHVNGQTNGH